MEPSWKALGGRSARSLQRLRRAAGLLALRDFRRGRFVGLRLRGKCRRWSSTLTCPEQPQDGSKMAPRWLESDTVHALLPRWPRNRLTQAQDSSRHVQDRRPKMVPRGGQNGTRGPKEPNLAPISTRDGIHSGYTGCMCRRSWCNNGLKMAQRSPRLLRDGLEMATDDRNGCKRVPRCK